MTNRKPRSGKAPLALLPIRPLRAISAAFAEGAKKYEPDNWRDDTPDFRAVYGSALRRHVGSYLDRDEPDSDLETGVHHLAYAGACVMILLWHEGVDYAAHS